MLFLLCLEFNSLTIVTCSKTMDAMAAFKEIKGERMRFQKLVRSLTLDPSPSYKVLVVRREKCFCAMHTQYV